MKRSILNCMLVLFLTGCVSITGHDDIHDFIPGTYVRILHDEFTRGVDSLIIQPINNGTETYSISKRSSYQQTLDGKKMPQVYKKIEWVVTYQPATKQLMDAMHERVFTFIPKENKLLMGSTTYIKK